MIDSSAVAKAKDTLLRALEQLEQAEDDLDGSVDRVDLVVVYSIGHDADDGYQEVAGWASTGGPKWLHAALLRRAAEANEDSAIIDDEPEDGGD